MHKQRTCSGSYSEHVDHIGCTLTLEIANDGRAVDVSPGTWSQLIASYGEHRAAQHVSEIVDGARKLDGAWFCGQCAQVEAMQQSGVYAVVPQQVAS